MRDGWLTNRTCLSKHSGDTAGNDGIIRLGLSLVIAQLLDLDEMNSLSISIYYVFLVN